MERQISFAQFEFAGKKGTTRREQFLAEMEKVVTKKGNQWYFGMKAHIGVDTHSGLVHSVTGTAANEADVAQTHALLHGEEEKVFADAGYSGVEKRPEMESKAGSIQWYIAAKRSKVKAMTQSKIQRGQRLTT